MMKVTENDKKQHVYTSKTTNFKCAFAHFLALAARLGHETS